MIRLIRRLKEVGWECRECGAYNDSSRNWCGKCGTAA